MHTAKLDEIVRQQDPALKSAVEMLATGQVSAALDALQQQGRVKEIPNREERVLAIAKTYIESPEKALQVYAASVSSAMLDISPHSQLVWTPTRTRNSLVLAGIESLRGGIGLERI